MRDPPGKEQGDRCCLEIGRLVRHRGEMDHIAGMIERHDDHYNSADNVDALYPSAWFCGGVEIRCFSGGG